MSAPSCSECGNRDATFVVTIDGKDEPMCDPHTAWWVQHSVPEPTTRPIERSDGSTP